MILLYCVITGLARRLAALCAWLIAIGERRIDREIARWKFQLAFAEQHVRGSDGQNTD